MTIKKVELNSSSHLVVHFKPLLAWNKVGECHVAFEKWALSYSEAFVAVLSLFKVIPRLNEIRISVFGLASTSVDYVAWPNLM